jgi:hypothetical protein
MPTTIESYKTVKSDYQRAKERLDSLRSESTLWKKGWQSMTTYIDPTRGIFDGDRTGIGATIDHETLLDSHATHAKETVASGLQTGTSDPARPWFKLSIDDFVSENFPNVKIWLDEVQKRVIYILQKSNIYDVLYSTYEELSQFGTGCFLVLEDMDDTIRGRSFTCGEYYLGVDFKGRVNAFGREFEMSASQMVDQFGLDNVSDTIKTAYQNNKKDQTFKVCHLIEENKMIMDNKKDFLNMPYVSFYWEKSTGDERFLDRRGFKRFPVIAPRWKTITTEMVYGYGPGWHAIGDIKELQVVHQDMLSAQEKLHNPPLQKDANVQGHVMNIPGGITTVSSNAPNSGLRVAYEVNPNLDSFLSSIDRLHRSIDRFFFADLFLMINSMDSLGGNPQKTAFEIAERKSEKMMMLGPILHRLNEELHDKLVEIVFGIMYDLSVDLWGTPFESQAMIPKIPQELLGREIRIQHVSILAQAQKALGIDQIQRVLGFVGNASAIYPQVMDNIDIDEAVRQVADMEGVPARIIMDRDVVGEIRDQRAQQQNMMMAMQAAGAGADATKKLADAKTSEPSALTGLMQGVGR